MSNNIVLLEYRLIEYYVIHLSKVLCTVELILIALIAVSKRSNPLNNLPKDYLSLLYT
jgi:hypothetical protein